MLVPLGVAVLWYFATNREWIGDEYLPRPQDLVEVMRSGFHYLAGKRVPFADGVYEGIWISSRMVLLGLVIGTPSGLAAGLAFGYSRLVRDLLEFTLDAIRPIPLFALIPLFLLWFGSDPSTGVFLISFGVFLILTIHVTEAVRNVPHIYVRASLTTGASRFHIYRTVVVPAILPHMMAGFRLAVVVSWGLVVAAEFMGAGVGLGWLQIGRVRYLDYAGTFVIVFMLAILAIFSDFVLRTVAKRFTRWSPRATASVSMVGEMLGSR